MRKIVALVLALALLIPSGTFYADTAGGKIILKPEYESAFWENNTAYNFYLGEYLNHESLTAATLKVYAAPPAGGMAWIKIDGVSTAWKTSVEWQSFKKTALSSAFYIEAETAEARNVGQEGYIEFDVTEYTKKRMATNDGAVAFLAYTSANINTYTGDDENKKASLELVFDGEGRMPYVTGLYDKAKGGVIAAFDSGAVYADNERKQLKQEQIPRVYDGAGMVSAGFFGEYLGCTTEISADTVRISMGDTKIVMRAGEAEATVNGKAKAMNTVPVAVGGGILVPIRFVSENLGKRISTETNGLIAICDAANVFSDLSNAAIEHLYALFGLKIPEAEAPAAPADAPAAPVEGIPEGVDRINVFATAQVAKHRPNDRLGWEMDWPGSISLENAPNASYAIMTFPFGAKTIVEAVGTVKLWFKIGSLNYIENDVNGRTSGNIVVHGIRGDWDNQVTWAKIAENMFIMNRLWGGNVALDQWVSVDVTDYLKHCFENDIASIGFAIAGSAAIYSDTSAYPPYIDVEWKGNPQSFFRRDVQNVLRNATVLYSGHAVSFINNMLVYVGGDDLYLYPQVEDGVFYIPQSYITKNFPGVSLAAERQINGVGYVSAKSFAAALDREIIYFDDHTVIITADPEAVNACGESVRKQIIYSKYGMYFEPEQAEVENVVNAGRTSFYHAQKKAFDERDSDEAIEKLAREFFPMLKLDKPELAQIKRAYEVGDFRLALRRYNKYFCETTKKLDLSLFTFLNMPSSYGELYQGIKTVEYLTETSSENFLAEKAFIGMPGETNWEYRLDPAAAYWGNMNMVYLITYHSLIDGTKNTGSVAYLMRWFDYMDDLYYSYYHLEKYKSPLDAGNVSSRFFGSLNLGQLMKSFQGASDQLCADYAAVGDGSLARFLLLVMKAYIPHNITYTDVMPQNWNIRTGSTYAESGGILNDFYYADMLYDLAVQRAESYATQMDYIDGAEAQRSYGYDSMLIQEYQHYNIPSLKKYLPEYMTGDTAGFYRDAVLDRANFIMRYYTNSGQYFLNGTNDVGYYMADPIKGVYGLVPEVLNDKVLSALQSATAGIRRQLPYVYPSLRGGDSNPYSGYYMMRDGWGKNDQNAMLIGGNSYAGDVGGTNSFVLNAYGTPMLTLQITGSYSNENQAPLSVDEGLKAFAQLRKLTPGHQNIFYGGLDDTARDNRNHSSDSFEYAEAVYDKDFAKGTVYNLIGVKRNAINEYKNMDVRHQRQVSFLKDCGLWIVADDIRSDQSHDYQLEWNIFCDDKNVPLNKYSIVMAQDTTVDERGTVRTNTPDVPNLTIFGVSNTPYKTSQASMLLKNRHYGEDYYVNEITRKFSAGEKARHISVIYPRADMEDDIEQLEKISGQNLLGFRAEVRGKSVFHAGALDKTTKIDSGGFKMIGESLTYQKEPDGKIKGMAMGATEFLYNGRPVEKKGADHFAFIIDTNGTVEVTPIYAPLEVPKVYPEVASFSGELEITMDHALGGAVDIIYTTDGSEPLLESAATKKYTGPFKIGETCTVKARAVRKGLEKDPVSRSATYASFTTRAYYTKNKVKPAIELPQSAKEGLGYRYYSEPKRNWGEVFLVPYNVGNTLVPKGEGISNVFDFTQADFSNPYAYTYTGYVYAGESGDYTFHLPEPVWSIWIGAGYSLCLYVDGERLMPSQRKHSMGTATVSLEKGYHKFELGFADYRFDSQSVKMESKENIDLVFDRKNPVPNFGTYEIAQYVWNGKTPEISVKTPSGKRLPLDKMKFFSE